LLKRTEAQHAVTFDCDQAMLLCIFEEFCAGGCSCCL
jgi:hypothetical protein